LNIFLISIILFSTILITIAFYFDIKIRIVQLDYSIPHGKILYSDLSHPQNALFSKKLQLKGKPDYILKTRGNKIIPVEVKTGNHFTPRPWHIMQLISYCHLVSESYHQNVPFGILVYYDTKKQFQIPFNNEYYTNLKSTIDLMNDHLKSKNVTRNHTDFHKCLHCSMRIYCSERLDEEKNS